MHALRALWNQMFGKRPTQGHILLGSLIFSLVAFFLFLAPGREQPIWAPTSSPAFSTPSSPSDIVTIIDVTVATGTMTPSITPSQTAEKSVTPTQYPTPFEGVGTINAPAGFDVVYWYTDYIQCDSRPSQDTFKVYGLIVSFSARSYLYKFSFSRHNESFAPQGFTATPSPTWTPSVTHPPTFVPASVSPEPNSASGELIIFDAPIVLEKGQYYHVTISFNWEGGMALWIEDIYYPQTKNDERCSLKNP